MFQKKIQRSQQALDENLSFQVRKDIQVEKQIFEGEVFYVVKDPLTLKYFRMKDVEHFIFTILDGTRNIKDVIALVHKRFGPLISDEDINGFILNLRNMNLLESFGPGADRILYHRSLFKKHVKLKQTLTSFLFIKIPLFDPDRLLNKIYPNLTFLWTRYSFYLWLALMGLAVFLAANKSELFISQAKDFFAPKNIVLIMSAVMIIKAFHEFGHALTCKFYGGEVHELGLLLVVFTPWLYTNVSDSWIFQKSRHRFLVSMAGIFTELLAASLAAILWWLTKPGILNSLCFNIIIVCSVDNLLRNANPLLRYDGYYALSDFLEIPNLRFRSTSYILSLIKKYLLKMPVAEEDLSGRKKAIYVVYGISSSIYRVFIVTAIAGFIASKFFFIGVMLAAAMVALFFIMPVYKGSRFIVTNKAQIRRGRVSVYVLTSIFLSLMAFLIFYHPHVKIKSSFSVEPFERTIIRVEVGGFLDELPKKQGERVKRGDIIAVLRNPELSVNYKMLGFEKAALEYEERKALSAEQITEYRQYTAQREKIEKDLTVLEKKLSKLRIEAPQDGIILTPKLDEKIGDYIDQGGSLCEIGFTDRMEIKSLVSGVEMPEIKVGQDVELMAYAYPQVTYMGKVKAMSKSAVQAIDNLAMSHRFGGEVPTEPKPQIGEVPRHPYFDVTIDINDPAVYSFRPGMTGRAKIYGDKRSFAVIIYQKIQKLLRPDLLL